VIELTADQRERLETGLAVEVQDSESQGEYVVLRKDVYERVQQMVSGELASHDELRAMLARSSQANGWDEPGMDMYDRYDEERAKRCKGSGVTWS